MRIFIFSLIAVLSVNSSLPVFAEGETGVLVAEFGPKDRYRETCDEIVSLESGKAADQQDIKGPMGKDTDCVQARNAMLGLSAQLYRMVIYGTVTALCTVACAYPALNAMCTVGNISGLVLDIGVQTNYGLTTGNTDVVQLVTSGGLSLFTIGQQLGSMGSSTTAAASSSATSAGSSATESSSSAGSESNAGSCLAAVNAGLQVAVAAASWAQMESQANSSVAAAEEKTRDFNVAMFDANDSLAKQLRDSGGLNNTSAVQDGSSVSGSTNQQNNSVSDSEFQETLYATAQAEGLQNFVTPQAQEQFKQFTGLGLRDLGRNLAQASGSPAQAAAALIGGNSKEASQIASILENKMNSAGIQSVARYSGGARRAPASKGNDFNKQLVGAMSGLMGALQPGAKGAATDQGAMRELDFRLSKGDPEAIAQDPRIGLFERTSFRYRRSQSDARLEDLPWASPYNQVTTGARR